MRLISRSAVALLFLGLLLVENGIAQIGVRPRPRQSKVPVMGRRQPLPSRRVAAGGGGGQPRMQPPHGMQPPPARNQGAIRPPPNASPFGKELPAQPMPRPHYPPPGNYMGHRHPMPNPGIAQPTQSPGPGGAPAGTLYCAANEYYRPGHELCCQREVVPLPYPMPSQNAQCCDGDAIDNRTESCCMGQEKVHHSEGACCGPEIYDPSHQGCCGHRIYRPHGKICCGGKIIRATNMICCRGLAVPVVGDTNEFECCGATPINIHREICCGHQVIEIGSYQQGCCGNRMVYNKELESCCTERTGRWRVRQGLSCEVTTTPKPPSAAQLVYIPGVGAVRMPEQAAGVAPGQGVVFPFMPHPGQQHPSVVRQNPGAKMGSRLFLFPFPQDPGQPQGYYPVNRNLPVTIPVRSIHQPPPAQSFQPIKYPSVLPTGQTPAGTRSIVYLSSPSRIPSAPAIP